MFTYIYYITIFYCSILFLSILDKFNKGEIKNKDDVKIFLMGKCFTILSKFYKLKRITNETCKKCLKYDRHNFDIESESESDCESDCESDSGSDSVKRDYKCNLHIFSNDKKINLKMKIKNKKIKFKEIDYDKNAKTYIEYNGFLKEINDVCFKNLSQDDINKFFKETNDLFDDKLLKDEKLFLNVELINGKLRNSDVIDLTNELQKYFIEDNIILSCDFLKYILKHSFDVKLDENYSLNIMTNDVEIINLSNYQKIKLLKKNDGEKDLLTYEILEN